MIAKISSGKSYFGLVQYNEKKVKEGKAEEIWKNYEDNSTLIETLEYMASLNEDSQKNTFHVSLSFPPDESPDKNTLIEIANDFMKKMGYEEQPYGVFQHFDTDNTHVHIVSSRINWKGKRIKDFQENRKAMNICAELEKKYGLQQVNHTEKRKSEIKIYKIEKDAIDKKNIKGHVANAIGTVLSDSLPENMEEFSKMLSDYGVGVRTNEYDGVMYYIKDESGNQISPDINASNIHFKPTAKRLETIFDKSKTKKKESKATLKPKFRWLNEYSAISMASFEKFLAKNNLQPDYVSNSGGIYGINFFDTKNKVFIKGSDIGCSWNSIKDKLNDSISYKTGEENIYIQRLYNKLQRDSKSYNESSFILSNTISELMMNEIKKCGKNELIEHLKPLVEQFCYQKVKDVEEIQKQEQQRVKKRAEMVRSYMALSNDIGACLIAYAFGYKIENNLIINDKDNIALKFDLHGFSIPEKKLYALPNEIKKAIKDVIMSMEKKNPDLVPECLAFSPAENFASALIHNAVKNTDLLRSTACQNYIFNNYERLSELCETKEELVGMLLYRGITFANNSNGEVEMIFQNKSIIIEDKELSKFLAKTDINWLNQKATVNTRKLSEINANDLADPKNGKNQTPPETENFYRWIDENFQKFNENPGSKENGENKYKEYFDVPNRTEPEYSHFDTSIIMLGALAEAFSKIGTGNGNLNVHHDKMNNIEEMTEEEYQEYIRQQKNKRRRHKG